MKLYGIAELAEAVGQRPATVSQWFKRDKLPEPDALLKMGPVWTGRAAGPWIRKQRKAASDVSNGTPEEA